MANKLGMLIIGGIIGAAASFFTSPRSGFENRNLAKDAVNAILGGSAVGGNQVVAQATQAAESAAAAGQEILKNAAEKGQEFYATASVKVREVAQNGIPGVAAQNAENDELRQKIEAARARIAAFFILPKSAALAFWSSAPTCCLCSTGPIPLWHWMTLKLWITTFSF